jgi:hypothetical protein
MAQWFALARSDGKAFIRGAECVLVAASADMSRAVPAPMSPSHSPIAGDHAARGDSVVAHALQWRNLLGTLTLPTDGGFTTTLPDGTDVAMNSALGLFSCVTCAVDFASERAFANHMGRLHRVAKAEHYLVTGATCEVCLGHFATRGRLLSHVSEKSSFCRLIYWVSTEPCNSEEARCRCDNDRPEQAGERKRGCRPVKARSAFFYASGPMLPLYVPYNHSRHAVHQPLRQALHRATPLDWTCESVPSGVIATLGFFNQTNLDQSRDKYNADRRAMAD